MDRATTEDTRESQVNADWQKCANAEVDHDSLVVLAHQDLVESQLMLIPLRENQSWATMDVSSERMMKYQLRLKHSQAAAATAPRLV